MNISASTVQVTGENGKSIDHHVAVPEGDGRKSALILIFEIFGLNNHIKDVTERFGREGYITAAPDLYYRQDKRVASNDDRDGAFALRGTLYDNKIVEDLNCTLAYLKSRNDVNPNKIGIVGYCFGGRVAWMGACKVQGLAACSVYYGGQIVGGERSEKSPIEPVTLANNIKIPMQCVWGEEDQGISKDARDKIEGSLKANNINYEWHLYKGAGHAFFCDDRPSYDEASAKNIWPKTLTFFSKHLQS